MFKEIRVLSTSSSEANLLRYDDKDKKPSMYPRGTMQIRIHIQNCLEYILQQIRKVPWISIMKSVPLWALLACHFCGNWADYTLMTNLPTFMKEVLKFDIKSVCISAVTAKADSISNF